MSRTREILNLVLRTDCEFRNFSPCPCPTKRTTRPFDVTHLCKRAAERQPHGRPEGALAIQQRTSLRTLFRPRFERSENSENSENRSGMGALTRGPDLATHPRSSSVPFAKNGRLAQRELAHRPATVAP